MMLSMLFQGDLGLVCPRPRD